MYFDKAKENSVVMPLGENGVNDGVRTHDNRNHNPGLYRLSYVHHELADTTEITAHQSYGVPGGIRTPDPQLRRLMLYPTELRALGRIRLT